MSCSKRGEGHEETAGVCQNHHHEAVHGNCGHNSSNSSCGHSKKGMGHSVKHVGVEALLGSGNSGVISELKIGQTVIDLGSGSGLDCIAAAAKVGPTGKVIGIDNSPNMIAAAEEKCKSKGFPEGTVQFKIGVMENIPVDDGTADVVISSFAINHSKDKPQVFRESARVLKSGGLLAIVDVVATAEIPDEIMTKFKEMETCLPESSAIESLKKSITAAGFENINVKVNEESRHLLEKWFQVEGMQKFFAVANISAIKS